MSIYLATLGIKVDATEADKAGVSLDRLATAGGKAEKATAALTGAMNNAKSATAEAERSISGASNSASAMAERAARLKASVDPLGAALDRVNGEMAEAETLYSRGAISASHYADAQTVLTARAERLRAAQADANRMLAGGAGAARLTSNEMLNLSRQASDVGGGGGKGASATASADKAVDAYTGPRDEYGAPTSSYSVLKPGRTVAGNDNGYAPTVGMAPASRGGDTFSASYTIDARGAEAGVEDRIRAVLEANEDRVVQRARQVSAADRAAGATRQRIGGS